MRSSAPGAVCQLLLIPKYSGINKGQRIHDRSKTAHRKPPVKCFLTVCVLCLTPCDTMDCSLPGSSVHEILQAKRLEWGSHSLLQGIFPTQRWNSHCRQILYCLSHQGSSHGTSQHFLFKKKIFFILNLVDFIILCQFQVYIKKIQFFIFIYIYSNYFPS